MINLKTSGQPSAGGLSGFGFPGAGLPVGGFDFSASAMGFGMMPLQNLFAQTMNMMTVAMMSLMTQMMNQQVQLLGGGAFGGGGGLLSSPLSGFLGGPGDSSQNPLIPKANKSKGGRIPGGKHLYTKGRGMYHKGDPGCPTYAFENSPAGIKAAAQRGYACIDLDMQITKDGVPVCTHWSRPLQKDGFYDPMGKIGKKTKVSEMTLAEVMRLRNKDGQSRIYPVATMIGELKKHGIAGDFEAKDDNRFATDRIMGYLADLVRDAGITANLKSIRRGRRSDKILQKAQEHGFWARVALAKKGERKYLGYGS